MRAGERTTVALARGEMLTVTASTDAAGSVTRLSDSMGGEPYSPVVIAGETLTFGPHPNGARFTIEITAGTVTTETGSAHSRIAVRKITGTAANLSAGDVGGSVASMSGSSTTFTVLPDSSEPAWPANGVITVLQLGAGALTIAAGAGVTINKSTGFGLALSGRYAVVQLLRTGVNEWLAFGSLGAG